MRCEAKEKLLEYARQARLALQIVSDLGVDLDNFHFREIDDHDEMDQLFRVALAQAWDARSTLREFNNKIREIVENAKWMH